MNRLSFKTGESRQTC